MNRVLREDEWNNLPSGLLDQVGVRVVVGDIFLLQISEKIKVQIISLTFQGVSSSTLSVCKPALLHC